MVDALLAYNLRIRLKLRLSYNFQGFVLVFKFLYLIHSVY